MAYKHFTIDERGFIALYLKNNVSISEIAELLERHYTSVKREIERNSNDKGIYEPALANVKAKSRQTNKKNHMKYNEEAKEIIELGLMKYWSPEQIINVQRQQTGSFVCHKTVYRWIRLGMVLNGDVGYLRRKGRPYKRKSDVNRMKGGKSIHDRPVEANERERLGDWELDTVVGSQGTTSCLVTVVDRKSRYLKAELLPNRKSEPVTDSLVNLLKNEPTYTLTPDNGKEFSGYQRLEKELDTEVFFADPYCSWQRGTNENTNGLLREFIPKGVDISNYSNEELQSYVYLINTRPRKVLNYATAEQVHCCPP